MTQLYVLSQSGDSAVNLSQFEYVYVGDDNKIKAVSGQRVIRLGDYKSRDGAKFALATMLYYAGKNPGGRLVSDDARRCRRGTCCPQP